MTTEHDPRTRVVLSWLQEDGHESAERVLLRALDEVDATPQRRSWWPSRRANPIGTHPRLVAAAAAVLAVAVVGYPFLAAGPASPGSRPSQPTVLPPLGPAANGVIALPKEGDIVVADRPGGATRRLVAGPEYDEQPAFSPDGSRLAFVRRTEAGSALMIADADGTNVVQLTEPLVLGSWSFAPDGQSLVVNARTDQWRPFLRPVDPAAQITVVDVPGADARGFRPTDPNEILIVAQVDPGGPHGIRVYDLTTGAIRTVLEPADASVPQNVGWLPSGEEISYQLWDGPALRARVISVDGSGDRALEEAPGLDSDELVSPWSNDGTRIVVSRGESADRRAGVVSATGRLARVDLDCGPTTDTVCPVRWSWSPDDSMLLGTTYHETSRPDEVVASYVQADPETGEVTELAWDGADAPTWQRVVP
jgi:WD40-like Beta Propeller Repeat